MVRIKPSAPGGYQFGSTAIERARCQRDAQAAQRPGGDDPKENITTIMEQDSILFGWMLPQIVTDALGRRLSGLEFPLTEE